MLLKIFKTSQPLSWILIVFLIVVVRLVLFLSQAIPDNSYSSPTVISYKLEQFNRAAPWLSHLFSTILVVFSGFFLNKISQSNNIVKGIHYLLVLTLGIFLSFSPQNLLCTPVIVVTPLLLYSYGVLLGQAKGPLTQTEIFNSLFFIGLSQLIFPPAFTLALAALVGTFYLNKPEWRQVAVLLIGFFTPILFYDVLIFTFGNSEMIFSVLQKTDVNVSAPRQIKWSTLGVFLLTLLHLFTYIKTSSRSIMKIRKTLIFTLFFLLFSVGFSFLTANGFQNSVINSAIPLYIVFTLFYLETSRNWLSDLAFLGLISMFTLSHLGY
jgi:hypothetical protein